MSTPVLYTFSLSVWAAAPEIAIVDLGYAPDAIEKKVVDLAEGQNFDPEFVRINSNASLPTLTANGKSYENTTDVVRYLVDNAPNKVVHGTPSFIERIHEDSLDPNFPLIAVRDEEQLAAAAAGFPFSFVSNRQNALLKFSTTPEAVPFKAFYDQKIAGNGAVLSIYKGEVPEEAKKAFFQQSQQHWHNIVSFILNELPGVIPTQGFLGGEVPGEDDFHLAAWLARIALLCGGHPAKGGYAALEKELQAPVPSRVAAYWDAWTGRSGWKQTYAKTLR